MNFTHATTLALLALASGGLPTFAQESGSDPTEIAQDAARRQDPNQDGAKAQRARTWLLHLADGRVLRTKAVETETGWTLDGGQTLTKEAVRRAATEHDVLAQARKLERTAERGEPGAGVAYADWLANEGLVAEALAALDRVLVRDPDQPQALAWAERTTFSIGLPLLAPTPDARALEQAFAVAARFGPGGQEIALARLAALNPGGEIPGGIALLESELVHADARRRAFATLALRRLAPGKALRELLSRAVLDRSQAVREGASLALRDAREEATLTPVMRALGSNSSTVRSNALAAIGAMNYPAAVEPLIHHLTSTLQSDGGTGAPRSHVYFGRQIAYVQDYDVEVAQNESIADPIINVLQEGVVLEAAVHGVREYAIQTERANTRRALARLTGADPGNTTTAWRRWWQENGDEWRAGPTNPPTGPSSPTSSDR